jgi:hypothetical protein
MSIKSLVRLGQSDAAIAKLKAYVAMTDAERSAEYGKALTAGGGKVVRDTKPGYLIPFSLGSDNKIMVPCRVLNGATGGQAGTLATQVKSITTNYVFETLPTATPPWEVPIFASAFKRPARVSLKLLAGASESRTSRVTGRPYSAKKSDSVSQSFGMKEAGTAADFNDVAKEAKTWAAGGEDRSYKMTPEGGR